jgi:hypothetical protein
MLAKRCKNGTTLVSNSGWYERLQVIYERVVDSINQLHNWLCIYFFGHHMELLQTCLPFQLLSFLKLSLNLPKFQKIYCWNK